MYFKLYIYVDMLFSILLPISLLYCFFVFFHFDVKLMGNIVVNNVYV